MLEARGIRKRVGGSTLLDDLNLSLKPGEVVGVSGGNGSGKTTLIDILMGRTLPDAGEVLVDGRVAVTKGRASRSRIFRTHQVPRLFFQMSIAENVCLGQWAFGPNGACNGALSGLPNETLSAYVLSVGQRRRVVLEWLKARIGHCRYFLLDEPTAGADSEYVASMEHFINTHKKDGVGFLVVEHKPDFLQRISDRMLSLRNGSLIPNALGPQPNSLPDASSSSSPNRQAILRAEGLSVRRGGANIVNNVTLTVSPGETLVVTGRNGCGKSSLLLALYGHPECELDAGRITFDGEDVSSLDHTARIQQGIHILPQEAATFDSLSVEEILQLTANIAGSSIMASEMQTLSEMMPQLPTILRRRCGVLSGGERRMVGIARLILLKPKLALLDEPMAGLSPEGRGLISSAISRLAATGTAVVVAEQQDLLSSIRYDNLLVIRGAASCPRQN